MEKIVFNHFYRLKHDLKRSCIISPNYLEQKEKGKMVKVGWISKIHPIYAMIFSFLSEPISVEDLFSELSYFLDVGRDEVEKLILPLLDADEVLYVDYKGVRNYFPKNIIISESRAFCKKRYYKPEDFIYEELDFQQERFYSAPIGITYVINTTCLTNCIYCYADKKTKVKLLTTNEIAKILKNIHDLGITTIGITGGEFFLHKDWKVLLELFRRYECFPDLISTKIPLEESEIRFFKNYKIQLQVSLDTLDSHTAGKMLHVADDYVAKMIKTLDLLDAYGIDFQVATILTKYNDNINNIERLYNFLLQFKHLRRWEIRAVFPSLYSNTDFEEIKSVDSNLEKIGKKYQDWKKSMNIQWNPDNGRKYYQAKSGSKTFGGSRCSANYSHIVILPDGQVTICEQLYWNSRFIIGDLKTQTIEDIWTSAKALRLAFPKRDDFREQSACKQCDLFDGCYSFPNRCIVDILKGYGDENWDYPDPRCAKAPIFCKNQLR